MKVEVTNIDQVRKKVEVILPEEMVKELENEIYDELKKQAKIRGFRPGKTPKSIIAAYYKDYVDEELKKRMVQTTMPEALSTAAISPVTEPFADFIESDGQRGYTLECEVQPEFEVPEYKGIEIEVAKIAVTDEELNGRLDGIRNMHAEMHMREEDSAAAKGDFLIIKYQGYVDGKPEKDIATEGYPLELGTTTLLADFETALIGMKAGEEKDVTIDFPDDYPDTSIASKTVVFHVTVKEIREKRLPDLNDEFAKDLSFDSMEAMRVAITKEMEKEKEVGENRNVHQQITRALVSRVDIPVPERYLEKRTTAMVEEAKSRFRGQGQTSAEEDRALDENLRKEFGPRTEERIKAEMIFVKIAEKEEITVSEDEVTEKIKKFAEDAKRPYSEVYDFYRQYDLMGGLRQGIMEEKTVELIRSHAVVKEKQ
ncbi:MAG: trigger factor [Syntrophobacterales bacterium]|nr:trigger factor [Syntrophobacterales bacterium]